MEDDDIYAIRYNWKNQHSSIDYFTLQELAMGIHLVNDYSIDWQYANNHHSRTPVYINFKGRHRPYSFTLFCIIKLEHLYYFAEIGLDQYKIKDMEISLKL